MYESGFAHGDVAPKNLFVERVYNSTGLYWKAYWIDLGLATEVNPKAKSIYYLLDRRECMSLFRLENMTRSQDL